MRKIMRISAVLFVVFTLLSLNACNAGKDSASCLPPVITEEGEWQHGEQNFFDEEDGSEERVK